MCYRILIVQTAFLGDTILATAIVEKLTRHYPEAEMDFLLRKGNEAVLENNPHIRKVLIFDKKQKKWRNLLCLIRALRAEKYDIAINLQRFFTSGLITVLSGAQSVFGFKKNPLSFFFSYAAPHHIGVEGGQHEVERNQAVISSFTDEHAASPRLYPAPSNEKAVAEYTIYPYVTMAPASVWYTKQLPPQRWVELIDRMPIGLRIYLVGAPGDIALCQEIARRAKREVVNLAGKLSILDSAALMKHARMNYVNDSAPLHICSAVNAPVTAFFCSTVPAFGFGPLSYQSTVVEHDGELYCRPCGLHGKKRCPEGHFRCAQDMDLKQAIEQALH